MKALKDFSHLGINVKAGEEVSDDLFEADVYPMLVMKGLINEVPAPSFHEVAESRKERSTLKKGTKK